MKNKLVSKVIDIEGNLYIKVPNELASHLSLVEGDFVGFSYKSHVRVWKDVGVDVPEDVFSLLIDIFKLETHVFQWLNTKQQYLRGNTPISLLSTDSGKNDVLDLIKKIEMGDFS